MPMQTAVRNSVDVHSLLTDQLDRLLHALRQGATIEQIVTGIADHAQYVLRHTNDQVELNALRETASTHPISEYIYQCPFSAHALRQPRGYPGDAALIDYVYGHADRAADMARTTPLGRRILQATMDRSAPAAIRVQRHIVADLVSRIAAHVADARILSVGCGHARELEYIDQTLLARLAAFVAFDQDAKSLEIAARYRARPGAPRIAPQCGTIMDLLKDTQLQGFALIYASGLYDYLSDRLCQTLTRNLFDRLKPGGTMLLTNFLPETPDIGYIELFMNGSLRYRTKQQIQDFAATINASRISKMDYFTDPHQNIGFLKIMKNVAY